MSRSRRPKKPAQNLGQKEQIMTEFDPSAHTADEVKDKLDEVSEDERLRIAAAEQAGKNRKSVLEAAGVEEDIRLDASGRRLHPWEVSPKEQEQAPA